MQAQVIPVWLVTGTVAPIDLLMAKAGFEASPRNVDRAGFTLSCNFEIRPALLPVTNNARNYCEIDLEEPPSPVLEESVARNRNAPPAERGASESPLKGG